MRDGRLEAARLQRSRRPLRVGWSLAAGKQARGNNKKKSSDNVLFRVGDLRETVAQAKGKPVWLFGMQAAHCWHAGGEIFYFLFPLGHSAAA